MIDTYQAEASVAFVAPEHEVLGLSVPAAAAPKSGRRLAGLDWRLTGGVRPLTAVTSVPTSIPCTTAPQAGVRPNGAFAMKHDDNVPGLYAWSPPN